MKPEPWPGSCSTVCCCYWNYFTEESNNMLYSHVFPKHVVGKREMRATELQSYRGPCHSSGQGTLKHLKCNANYSLQFRMLKCMLTYGFSLWKLSSPHKTGGETKPNYQRYQPRESTVWAFVIKRAVPTLHWETNETALLLWESVLKWISKGPKMMAMIVFSRCQCKVHEHWELWIHATVYKVSPTKENLALFTWGNPTVTL